jgi:hypothetical protein
MMKSIILLLLPALCWAFVPSHLTGRSSRLFSTVDADTVNPTSKDMDELKAALVFVCNRTPSASLQEVRDAVEQLESMGEQVRTDVFLP